MGPTKSIERERERRERGEKRERKRERRRERYRDTIIQMLYKSISCNIILDIQFLLTFVSDALRSAGVQFIL